MAKETCPSCGAVYNGRKCRNCLYRPMAARKVPASRPKNEAKPSPRPKSRSALRSLLGFVILLILIALLLPILQNWGQGLKAREEAQAVPLFPASSSAVP